MSSVSNDSHIDWRKWMDADVSVRSNKWRNKCKAFWVLSDKCLYAHVYWLGAVFLSLLFIKALIKSYGQILQTPQRPWLCLLSRVQGEQEVDTNCKFGVTDLGKPSSFSNNFNVKYHFTNISHGWQPTCIQGSSLLYTLSLTWVTEKRSLPAVKVRIWRELWRISASFSALKFVLLTISSSKIPFS